MTKYTLMNQDDVEKRLVYWGERMCETKAFYMNAKHSKLMIMLVTWTGSIANSDFFSST